MINHDVEVFCQFDINLIDIIIIIPARIIYTFYRCGHNLTNLAYYFFVNV